MQLKYCVKNGRAWNEPLDNHWLSHGEFRSCYGVTKAWPKIILISIHYLLDSANSIARAAIPIAEIAVRIRLTNGF